MPAHHHQLPGGGHHRDLYTPPVRHPLIEVKPGDDANGIAKGSFADYTVGRADKFAPKPTPPPERPLRWASAAPLPQTSWPRSGRTAPPAARGSRALTPVVAGGRP